VSPMQLVSPHPAWSVVPPRESVRYLDNGTKVRIILSFKKYVQFLFKNATGQHIYLYVVKIIKILG